MKPGKPSFTINNLRFHPAQRRISLKKEDKILLTIGGIFLLGVLAFLIFENTLFSFFGSPHNSPIQKTLSERKKAENEMDKMLEESSIQFQKNVESFERSFEQRRKSQDKNFQQAVDNFHDRFEKAKKNFKL